MTRSAVVFLALAGAGAFAQDLAARRAIVRIEVTDEAVHQALALRQQSAPVQLLRTLRIHQPYTVMLSGVVVSPDGEILTTALHPRAQLRVQVTLFDGTQELATLVGNDPLGNVALIRIPAATPNFLRLNEEGAELSAKVDLYGHSLARDLEAKGTVVTPRVPVGMEDVWGVNGGRGYCIGSTFLVASVTGGFNPGAACVDDVGLLRGMVVGSVPRATPASRDLTFVLPAARLARIVSDFRANDGKVVRAHFGLRLVPATEILRAHLPDLPDCAASVVEVDPGGPAAKAGVRHNDIVLSLGAQTCVDACDLGEAMTDCVPGRTVRLELLRERRKLTVDVTPARRP